jgi:hypothetical protein
MRVCLQLKAPAGGGALDHPGEACRGERRTALADEHERRRGALALQLAQRSHLVAPERVCSRRAFLRSADVQHGRLEVDLRPIKLVRV